MSKTSPNDLITITRADLIALADTLAGDDRCGMTKPAILNKVAATLLGPKHDWARIKNADAPVVSQRAHGAAVKAEAAETSISAEQLHTVMTDLTDNSTMGAKVGTTGDGAVEINFDDGHMVWVERNDGRLKVHVYNDISESPASIWSALAHRPYMMGESYLDDAHPTARTAPIAGPDMGRVIGYQVDNYETGENWGDRPSYEIIPYAVARKEWDAANDAGEDGFRLLPIHEGDVEEPTFSEV